VTETERRIARIFLDALGVEVSAPTLDIIENGILDSLALVTLLFELEREFSVTIPLELDLESLRTVERLATLVERIAGQAGSPP
jgi:acyl carrier protein